MPASLRSLRRILPQPSRLFDVLIVRGLQARCSSAHYIWWRVQDYIPWVVARSADPDGQPLVFTGTATGLFGLWIKWFLLSVITLGIYLLWVGPRIEAWKWENTTFAAAPVGAGVPGVAR
ncbi:DUF898 family protein [Cellulomonas denverensis]|uniref:DUF898 domain-containing protein n=1 Tax=Cellulomonas denverensis TaxID=264297 RepID=A0A7X6QYR0_9CELL|nr:DUF898 family protein [Cellulomonas denverensis]NKY22405.1 DUF898 domain-containing protein [Cellulomonas denverensis]